ncbi:MAG: hypothetical protein U0838_03010 [Chloroflexota bacterium]
MRRRNDVTRPSANEVRVIRFRVSPLRPVRAGTHDSHARKHRAPLLLAAAALAFLTLGVPAPAEAAGTVHYMSPKGNDSASGTASHPWRTLYASLRKLHAGDTLYVRGGTYPWSGTHYSSLAGTATRPIRITNYPGETPVFSGSGSPANWLFFDGNAAYVTLHGLVVKGGGAVASSAGSSLIGFTDNTNHITLDHMRLYAGASWTTTQHLVYFEANSVNDITIKYSVFDGAGCKCTGLISLYHDPNAVRVNITRNTFRNADQAILIWSNASVIRITSNTFTKTRIAVRHHNSNGTLVSGNRGTGVSIGVAADSRANLSVTGNSW